MFIEPAGASVPEELKAGLTRGFTEEERRSIYAACGCVSARQGLEAPLAVWVLGPSACGKTHITQSAVEGLFGEEGGVVVDGGVFREHHEGWLRVVRDGLGRATPGIHREAWDTFKQTKCSERMKADVFTRAVRLRQNVIVPDCVGSLSKTRAKMEQVRAAGYGVVVLAIVVSEAAALERGTKRSLGEGKTFSTRGYVDSVRNTLEIVCGAAERSDAAVQTYCNEGSGVQAVCGEEFERLSLEYLEDGSMEARMQRLDSNVSGVGFGGRRRGGSLSGLPRSDTGASISEMLASERSSFRKLLRTDSVVSSVAATSETESEDLLATVRYNALGVPVPFC